MKVEVVVDARGTPVGLATDAAHVAETDLAPAALAHLPFGIAGAPRPFVVADRAYDSDPLRDRLRRDGFTLVCPHRTNRVAPPTADGRDLRRYKRRYVVERTFAWLPSFRRVVTRYERTVNLYDGFVHLACAFLAINKPC